MTNIQLLLNDNNHRGWPVNSIIARGCSANRAFTLVELLIVIVVIAILAAITIVAYNGIQDRANNSVVQSDMSDLVKATKLYEVTNDGAPPTADQTGLQNLAKFTKASYNDNASASTVTYCRSNTDFSYYGRSKAKVQYIGSSKLGVQTAAWVGAPDDKCAAGGIATTDAGYARIDLLVGTWAGAGAGWLSWVQ